MIQTNKKRRLSHTVHVGKVAIGGDNPIVVQTMTNTSTLDTLASVAQIKRVRDAGAKLVRLTAQGVREAAKLEHISHKLHEEGVDIALSADIHFNPQAAFEAVKHVDKVRINPGNFVKVLEGGGADVEQTKALLQIEDAFIPLIDLCKQYGKALRIGVNHGSLSERIVHKYGDTVEGMVESCMEFLAICQAQDFASVVISMKSSNTGFMVAAVELLYQRMSEEGMTFPLHLGVTEAGEGEDGRIKSAVGIGSLLMQGLGDTIRVSLSEEPECEIPVAQYLVDYVMRALRGAPDFGTNGFEHDKRVKTKQILAGKGKYPVVVCDAETKAWQGAPPDYIYGRKDLSRRQTGLVNLFDVDVCPHDADCMPVFKVDQIDHAREFSCEAYFLMLDASELKQELLVRLSPDMPWVLIVNVESPHICNEVLHLQSVLKACAFPVILKKCYVMSEYRELMLAAASDFGLLFLKNYIEGIYLENDHCSKDELVSLSFSILQAARVRISKTEYISCPGCGRTNFALQQVVGEVKRATAHLKGLKIGVMGCIVNGPGEMADADYGYVGSSKGKVSLYKKQMCVERSIPEDEAVDKLVALIKDCGDWQDE